MDAPADKFNGKDMHFEEVDNTVANMTTRITVTAKQEKAIRRAVSCLFDVHSPRS
jgi:hypothetical protein